VWTEQKRRFNRALVLLVLLITAAAWAGCAAKAKRTPLRDRAKTHSLLYGYIDMGKDGELNAVVFRQIVSPERSESPYIFSGFEENAFFFDNALPNTVYEFVRFESLYASFSGERFKKRDFRYPRGRRMKIATPDTGHMLYLGAFRFVEMQARFALEPLESEEYEKYVLQVLLARGRHTAWEPVIRARLLELEGKQISQAPNTCPGDSMREVSPWRCIRAANASSTGALGAVP